MKKLLLALVLFILPTTAFAQCNGIFPNNTICGNATGSSAPARPTPNSVLTGVPGGSNGQIQYNAAGVFGGLTNAQVAARLTTSSTVTTSVALPSTVVYCDATSGALTLTAPTPAANLDIEFVVKKIDVTTNACNIVVSGGSNIDFAATWSLANIGEVVKIKASTAQYWVIQ